MYKALQLSLLFFLPLLISNHNYGDGSKRKDSLKNRKQLLRETKVEEGKIFYLNKIISTEEYEKNKKEELKIYKDDLKSLYKLEFNTHYTKHYNIAHRCNSNQVSKMDSYLKVFFDDIYSRYFIYEPRFTLRIIFFKTKAEFIKVMGYNTYGVYFPESDEFYTATERTLYTYCGSGDGTLWHEMVHSFVDLNTDYDVQQWFNEGFASFYEMGSIQKGKFIEGYTNWRHPELQRIIREKKLTPLKKFLLSEDMREDYGYAAARFLFCYLWMENKMIPFVQSYVYELSPNYSGKELGQKTIQKLEELTGKSIDQIESEYITLALKHKKYEKLNQKK